VQESIQFIIDTLTHHIEQMEVALRAAIRETPELRAKDELLCSVPGIDPEMSYKLLLELPDMGNLTSEKIASCVGVAPPSGDHKVQGGSYKMRGGTSYTRKLVYLATEAAIAHDPKMRAFHDRLRSSGKPQNVAIVACMRRMLVLLNAILKKKEPYVDSTG
jgi:transposase